MRRLTLTLSSVVGIDLLPDDIAWRLVESVYTQRGALVVGVLTCAVLGGAGYLGTGSVWYLVGLVYTLVIAGWRLAQVSAFQRGRDTATPSAWAVRNLASGAATALGWGAWTLIVAYEPEKALVAMVLGIHAGLITGGAVRNNAVRVIATTQTLIASPPLFIACLVAPSPYLHLYAGIVGIHFLAALSLAKFLNEQTMRILLSEQQARELAAKLASANEELALVNEHLEEQVGLDPLTELPNRRAFDLAAAREWRSAAREARPVAVMMIDVDHFKLFNDHYGHLAGDDCLRLLAVTMAAALRRPGDLLARYGGEEFIAIMPSTGADAALQIAERILAELADRALEHAPSQLGRISVSIGLADATPAQDLSLKHLIACADQALYVAKGAGRNRAHRHEPVQVSSLTAA